MELGLSIVQDGTAKAYRFRFEVTDVFLSADKFVQEGQRRVERHILCFVCRSETGWTWETIEAK